jgi:Na+-driven multidrug efflux pump
MKEAFQIKRAEVVEEFYEWGKISCLSILKIIAGATPWLVTLAFIGRISSTQLAAMSLVELWIFTILGIASTSVSQVTAILVSQAHGMGSQKAKYGWLLVSMVAMTIVSAIELIPIAFTYLILPVITHDEELIRGGSHYASMIYPAMFFCGYREVISTYLTASGHAEYSVFCSFFFSIEDIIITYICLFGSPMIGFTAYPNAIIGNGVAWNMTSFLGFIINIIMFLRTAQLDNAAEEKRKASGEPPAIELSEVDLEDPILEEIELLKNDSLYMWLLDYEIWHRFLSLMGPFFVTACTENLVLLAMGFLIGKLSRAQIAAHNTCIGIIEYAFSFVNGMAQATTVRVGYYVGKGDYHGSMVVCWISSITGVVSGLFISVVCSYYSNEIAGLFTMDVDVINAILLVFPFLWPSVTIFSIGHQMLGVLKGQGRASAEMFASFIGLWFGALPLAYFFFTFYNGSLQEIWLALFLGYIITDTIALYFVYYSDWESVFLHAKGYEELSH